MARPVHPLLANTRSDIPFLVKVPKRFWTAYFKALGEFCHEFAAVESMLPGLVVREVLDKSNARTTGPTYSGGEISKPGINAGDLMKSAMSEMRVGPAMAALKRVLRMSKASKGTISEVERLLKQVGEIQFLRNRLAHHAAQIDATNREGWLEVSNQDSALEPDQVETLHFQMETLHNAADDLRRIRHLLGYALNPAVSPPVGMLGPWRYTPAQLRRGGQKSLKNRQGQKRQRVPSSRKR